jgi:hypothetical protein
MGVLGWEPHSATPNVLSPCYNGLSVADDLSATGCGGHNRRVAACGGLWQTTKQTLHH